METVLYGALLLLGFVGLISAGRYNLLPAEIIFECVFALAVLLSMSRLDIVAAPFFVTALAYIGLKLALMVFSGENQWLDFIQAYKAYFYLIGLAFFVRRNSFDGLRLVRVTAVLIALFFVKYGYSQLLGLSARPGVYDENNFELFMLIGLFYLGFHYAGQLRDPMFGVLAATVVLSGSRSGAIGLLILYVALYLRPRNRFWPVHLLGLAALVYAVVAVFARREPQGIESIDRFHFLQTFLREVRPWPLWEFLTGSYPITPLSRGSCAELSFWTDLFSHSDPGVCYSVILHSYLLRAIFDQGLLGLTLLYALLWIALRRSGASLRDVFFLLSIMTVSGLSVSAFNNVYAAITFAVALGLDRRVETEPSAPRATLRGAGVARAPRNVPARTGEPDPHGPDAGPTHGSDGNGTGGPRRERSVHVRPGSPDAEA